MSKVVNLRQARKSKARAKARAKGDENAARHGETKETRALREAREAQKARRLDGAKRDPERGPE